MSRTVMFMPHPPIIIKDIGGKEADKASETIKGMTLLAKKISEIQPDTIVFISPHGNAFSDATSVLDGEALEGSFQNFGFPNLKFNKTC